MQPVRLVMAMYRCALVVPSASLGKVYAVLHRRDSQVLSEDMRVCGERESRSRIEKYIDSLCYGALYRLF